MFFLLKKRQREQIFDLNQELFQKNLLQYDYCQQIQEKESIIQSLSLVFRTNEESKLNSYNNSATVQNSLSFQYQKENKRDSTQVKTRLKNLEQKLTHKREEWDVLIETIKLKTDALAVTLLNSQNQIREWKERANNRNVNGEIEEQTFVEMKFKLADQQLKVNDLSDEIKYLDAQLKEKEQMISKFKDSKKKTLTEENMKVTKENQRLEKKIQVFEEQKKIWEAGSNRSSGMHILFIVYYYKIIKLYFLEYHTKPSFAYISQI